MSDTPGANDPGPYEVLAATITVADTNRTRYRRLS